MAWSSLRSSNLDAYDYDGAQRILHVRFRSGQVYSYRDVDAETARGLSEAESPGRYFIASIRDRFRHV